MPYADIVTTTTTKLWRPVPDSSSAKEEYAKIVDGNVFQASRAVPMHAIAGKLPPSMKPCSLKAYQQNVIDNAQALAHALMDEGFKLVSVVDTHLMPSIWAEEEGGPSGKDGGTDLAGITANKNTVPFDTRSPFVASGIRFGTPSVTTRGMGAVEKQIAAFIKSARQQRKRRIPAAMKAEVRPHIPLPLYPNSKPQLFVCSAGPLVRRLVAWMQIRHLCEVEKHLASVFTKQLRAIYMDRDHHKTNGLHSSPPSFPPKRHWWWRDLSRPG